jgi:hypothetical protein
MFEDWHLVYAGVGAAAATAVCIVVMLSMMRFATSERPDSLAAVVSLVAAPLECDFGADLADASSCKARLAARFQRANENAETDAVFALETIVTRQGKLTNFAALRSGRHASASQANLIEGLLDHVSKSRFESVPPPRLPDFSGMVWLVEHATVRANNTKPALDLPLPPKSAPRCPHASLALLDRREGEGSGFLVQGAGFVRVPGSEFRVQGSGLLVQGSFSVRGSEPGAVLNSEPRTVNQEP